MAEKREKLQEIYKFTYQNNSKSGFFPVQSILDERLKLVTSALQVPHHSYWQITVNKLRIGFPIKLGEVILNNNVKFRRSIIATPNISKT